MRTNQLIAAMVADNAAAAREPSPTSALAVAALLGGLLTAGLFAGTLGPRPDVAAALATPRFLLKFVEAAALAAAAAALAARMVRPASPRRLGVAALALVGVLVAGGVVAELMVTPAAEWSTRLLGTNALHCLLLVPALAVPPFALLMLAARHGAPTEPGRAGAVIGLASAGIGAFFYAANCADDSPLFVAVWYTLAVALVAGVGAAVGRRALAW